MSIDASIFQGLSWNLASDVRQLFIYHFMVNALVAGTAVAVMAAVVGWVMVLRRQAVPGAPLSLLALPGAAGGGPLWGPPPRGVLSPRGPSPPAPSPRGPGG